LLQLIVALAIQRQVPAFEVCQATLKVSAA
jgi:hypothetical protein